MIFQNPLHEVAIIGAGPAGTTLALALLQAGLKPVIIDKAAFPRPKVCAGGLTIKALQFLPRDIGTILADEISRVNLSFNLNRGFTKSYPQPLLHTVDRRRFDAFLAERVQAAGGEFRQGERLESLTKTPGGAWRLETSRGSLRARVIVGADGARSAVARGAGLQPVDFWHLGLQAEVPRKLIRTAVFDRTIWLDMGSMPDGYAWGFPRGDLLLIGVGGPLSRGRELKGYQARVLSHLGLDNRSLPLAAHLIPHRVTPRPVCRDQVLLVGDAAGLADFWTGEGIFFALMSAALAARQIVGFFQGEADALAGYQSLIDREITPELTSAYQFSKIFNYLGPLAFRCLERYDYPWEVFCRVMRGDRSFLEVKSRFRPDILLHKLLVRSARNRPIA
ncbi:MAG: NAD(P)/FAD-dependent oxidoreductase [Syntrophobacterales bacterium]|jgi:geranylgeranyl reductase family protein|nr:NAD(P)/FAD-dependent oxidoreductase [Syntrophobacterales bacterium]